VSEQKKRHQPLELLKYKISYIMRRIDLLGRFAVNVLQRRGHKNDVRPRARNKVQEKRLSADLEDILRGTSVDGRYAEIISDLGISFMQVKVSTDYRTASVEWACPPGHENIASKFIAGRVGFFRARIAEALQGKHTPKLLFVQKKNNF